ncbi:major capsid protein [Dipodfec virus UOA04_Rod_809]|nr:major capsid protein [Dipodfec virus UOA04_Rod_809]
MKTNAKTSILTQSFKTPGLNAYPSNFSKALSMTPSVLYPIPLFYTVPRGQYRVNLNSVVKTLTASAPILNGFNCRVSLFHIPYRLYVPSYRVNSSYSFSGASTNFSAAQFPRIRVQPAYANATGTVDSTLPTGVAYNGIGPSSVLNCLGLPVGYSNLRSGGQGTFVASNSSATVTAPAGEDEYISAFELLSYWDIYRNYFMNTAQTTGYVLAPSHLTDTVSSGSNIPIRYAVTGSPYYSMPQKLSFLHQFSTNTFEAQFEGILQVLNNSSNSSSQTPVLSTVPWQLSSYTLGGYSPALWSTSASSGLFVKSAPFDFVNARVNTSRYQEAIARSIVDVSGGRLSMQSLVDGRRLYDYFTKAAWTVRFDQWIKAEFGVDIRKYLDIPMLLRTWSFDIDFNSLFASAAGANDQNQGSESDFGEQAGYGYGKRGGMKLNYTAEEYGLIMAIVSVEPDAVHTLTVNPFLHKLGSTDLFTPSFDRMGMQDVPADQVDHRNRFETGSIVQPSTFQKPYWFSVNPDVKFPGKSSSVKTVGYQPSWSEYCYPYSSAAGYIADPSNTMSTWLTQPLYYYGNSSRVGEIPDRASMVISPYSSPLDSLRMFPDTTANSQPFIFALNVRGRQYLPISQNQISKL